MVTGSLKAVADELNKCESVLIFAHENPDGDAIGSAVSAGLILKSLGKKVDYAIEPKAKNLDAILPQMKDFFSALSDSYDAALLLDCSTLAYVANKNELERCRKLIVIDHHKTNEGIGDAYYIDSKAAAVGEIIFDLAGQLNVAITPDIARAIYVSIHEDTGSFEYSNTRAKTHEVAAELHKVCEDLHLVCDMLKITDKEHLDLIQLMLNNLNFYCGGKIAIATLSREKGFLGYDDSNTENLINYARYTRGCILSVLIRQIGDDTFKVSMRSGSDKIDVAKISTSFGGGGHAKAAGFTYKGRIEDLESYFINLESSL